MNSSLLLISNVSASNLRRAAEIKDRIEELESELNNILGMSGVSTPNYSSQRPTASGTGARNKMSAAGLARIRAAQKARWARFRATKPKAAQGRVAAAPGRRTMSPAARAKIAAAARARWRKAKAAGRNAL